MKQKVACLAAALALCAGAAEFSQVEVLRQSQRDAVSAAYVLRTPETGQIKLEGLREQTYYLQETRPPDGVLETAEDCEISITENGKVMTGNREVGEKGIELICTPAYSGREKKPLSLLEIYQKGSRLLAAALTFLVATRRHYLN